MSHGNGGRTNGAPREEPVVGYLARVEIEDIRSIASLRWEVTPGPGWNVVLGDNGSGKSTFLRAIVLALLVDEEHRLPVDLGALIRSGRVEGRVRAWIAVGESADLATSVFEIEHDEDGPFTASTHQKSVARSFSAGYGPFRRFTGGDSEYEKEHSRSPRLARHMSLFSERYSLQEGLSWLKLLRFKELEQDSASASLLASLRAFVNQEGFLPNGARLARITSDSVVFIDGNGAEVPVDELSDGYRSILSLTFELIRQLAAHHGADRVFNASSTEVVAPGIVLIDEVDAHLHPTWQRRIGGFLRKCFPAIQFVVTTHSPLVCQAADVGTVFRLPRPGSDEVGAMVTGPELDALLYGDLADAYATDAMGEVGRSDKGRAMLDRLAALNRKEIDQGLSDEETKEQRGLRRIFGGGPLPVKQA
jgi:energy-coupling factor transporter ATP-binding protein EcfA2